MVHFPDFCQLRLQFLSPNSLPIKVILQLCNYWVVIREPTLVESGCKLARSIPRFDCGFVVINAWQFVLFESISLPKLILMLNIWQISLSLTSLIPSPPSAVFVSRYVINRLWRSNSQVNDCVLFSLSQVLGSIESEWLDVVMVQHILIILRK